jgi:hypothetical protein
VRTVLRGTFVVERLLPPTEAGSPQYWVKHAIDRHERVVQESQPEGKPRIYRNDRARIEGGAKTGLIQYGQEATMAVYRNYGQERAERNRLKRVKKDAKLRELEEAVARRKATLDPTSSLPEPELVKTADAPDR